MAFRGTVIAPCTSIMADLDSDPAGAGAFSELELEFFRAGDAMSAAAETITPEPTRQRAGTEPVMSEEDWDWKIAMARARHATQPG